MENPLELRNAKNYILPVAAASSGLIAGKVIPSAIGMTGFKRTGVQAGLGIATLMFAKHSTAAKYFAFGLLGIAAAELIGKYIPSVAVAGLADEYQPVLVGEPLAEEESSFEAYPYDVSGFETDMPSTVNY